MKILSCFFLFSFFIGNCLAQNTNANVTYIKSIPQDGVLLDNGWKFQQGDNSNWAAQNFNDASWQSINPSLDVTELSQLKPGNIYWLRLHIVSDTNFLKKILALTIQQSGASEVYLNGKLIYRFGLINFAAKKITAYDPLDKPLPYLPKTSYQVFAVRYVLQPNVFYTRALGTQNYGLHIKIKEMVAAQNQYQQMVLRFLGQDIFRMGFWFMLTVLHLAFFIFYPPQKANLFFCLYAFFNTLGHLGYFLSFNDNSVANKFYYGNISECFYTLCSLLIVTALYSLLQQKRGYIYWIVISSGILLMPLNFVSYSAAWPIGTLIFSNLVNLEIVRISFKSIIIKKRGAWIIATGAISFIVFWLLYRFSDLLGIKNQHVVDVFFNLANISYPIVISIYLGLEFAFTNRSLKQKLLEVETLSAQTIVQEQEKQQILASQNEMLEQQVKQRTSELSKSLNELKTTQTQLIQSEKMASLGELTAGIAHEIQNPLNFVNNFSEVNAELIDEMQNELTDGNKEQAIAIANNIKENEQKIIHHGKRADAIVKGMLQHSRKNSNQKEPTDINVLCDEYLKLSYHGLRAKDKNFNAIIETNFDESIEKINVVPQDIGRVLLNLFNNAFYATSEKQKAESLKPNAEYKPIVLVQTKSINDKIEIVVSDNGNGIPQNIIDKIFQPFFTTKPTGQGTGLGLSLAYDIITKEHNGTIKAESKEGEGSEFIIELRYK